MARITLLEKVAQLTEQVRVLTKELEQEKNNAKYAQEGRSEAQRKEMELAEQVEQMHSLIDALGNAVPRETVTQDRWGSDIKKENSLIVRFAASLARK